MSVQDENEYEDLLGLWSDLESGLGVLLSNPLSVREFEQRVVQYDRWLRDLLRRDADLGLYLLFQLATNSWVGYSASHSLVCATLCHLLGNELRLDGSEHDSLVHAALTMNIAMTELQDQLALQTEKPGAEQQEAVRTHAPRGAHLLADRLGVADSLWVEIVRRHHDEDATPLPLNALSPLRRLVRILHAVDRYAAMISPRKSRAGRSTTESVRAIMNGSHATADEVGHALVRAVGLCPPGTYVQLENNALALVVRRSERANLPHVAVLTGSDGQALPQPRLHQTLQGSPSIKAALATALVRLRPNHHQILQLGAQAHWR
ncbi:HD-GYP domain-containing protein [Hylemonella sp. W303a]|uniref:HD-GYP domain-containing protein n=1 Tax=Hylemonella sp. W303a TaxID=3389873 RepID=UPI00396B2892